MTEVTCNLKADAVVCPCGCLAIGRPRVRAWSDGLTHNRNCDYAQCRWCRNARNSSQGKRRQAKAITVVGIPTSTLRPSNEEHLGGTVRLEVKSGAQVGPILTRWRAAEAQSEAQRPVGDHRPFVMLAMPNGVSWGLVLVRTDRLAETVAALAEQLGMVE